MEEGESWGKGEEKRMETQEEFRGVLGKRQ